MWTQFLPSFLSKEDTKKNSMGPNENLMDCCCNSVIFIGTKCKFPNFRDLHENYSVKTKQQIPTSKSIRKGHLISSL